MVFISCSWGQGNGSYGFFRTPLSVYPCSLARIGGYVGWSRHPAVAEPAGTAVSELIDHCLRPHRVAVLLLLLSVVCFAKANADARYHEVRSGDSLSKIAKVHGVSYHYLACLNNIADPHHISVGQRIELPLTPRKTQHFDLIWPLNQGWVSSPFGPRRNTCHHGIDIAAPRGTVVRSANDGRVVFSGKQNGYGLVVIVSHAKGYDTLYAHLQRTYVKKGQRVRSGKPIAEVGSSGRSTGAHLHFELRNNGKALDPMAFLPKKTQIVFNRKAYYGAARGGK